MQSRGRAIQSLCNAIRSTALPQGQSACSPVLGELNAVQPGLAQLIFRSFVQPAVAAEVDVASVRADVLSPTLESKPLLPSSR